VPPSSCRSTKLRVDRDADVGDRRGLQHAHVAGLGIDLDLGGADADLPEDWALGVRAGPLGCDLAAADQLAAASPKCCTNSSGNVAASSSSLPAISTSLARTSAAARCTARPAIVVERLAPVERS